MNKYLKNILLITLSFVLLLSILIFSVLWTYSNNIPDYKFLKNYKPPVSSKVYSGNGELVADFSKEKRIFVPYNSIPKNVINSFLSAEDKNFFSHPGVDAKGVLRAVVNNISNIISSKRLEGASTITQQVAKNFLLTNEVSLNRKIKEAILAFRIERALSKQRILELYLNQIYLGSGAYGVAAASLEYFDKSIKELNYNEAALLAALPKAPSKYNPYRNKDLAKFRRNLVLNNLFENNLISEKKYLEFKDKPIELKKIKKVFLEDSQYYIEDVRKNIINQLTYEKVYKQGYNINTPINLKLQKIATRSLRNGLIAYDKRKGWRGPLKNINYTKKWLEKIEIETARIDDRPSSFSGGMQQRLQIARNLVTNPRLIFMDEPTGGLDVSVQAKLLDLVRSLVRQLGLSAIIVTHDLAVVRLLADRLIVMKSGKIVEQGLTDQVLDDPQHQYTQLLVSSVLRV